VDPKREGDEALNVADFKIDDILNVPGDQLLAEVAEDFGDPAFLAAQFDLIALPAVSSHNPSRFNRAGAMATFPAQPERSRDLRLPPHGPFPARHLRCWRNGLLCRCGAASFWARLRPSCWSSL
jgi:hypothetical protein